MRSKGFGWSLVLIVCYWTLVTTCVASCVVSLIWSLEWHRKNKSEILEQQARECLGQCPAPVSCKRYKCLCYCLNEVRPTFFVAEFDLLIGDATLAFCNMADSKTCQGGGPFVE